MRIPFAVIFIVLALATYGFTAFLKKKGVKMRTILLLTGFVLFCYIYLLLLVYNVLNHTALDVSIEGIPISTALLGFEMWYYYFPPLFMALAVVYFIVDYILERRRKKA